MTTIVTSDESRKALRGRALGDRPFGRPPERCAEVRRSLTAAGAPPHTGLAALVLIWRRLVLFVVGMVTILGAIELTLALAERDRAEVRRFVRRKPTPYVEFYSEPNYHGWGQDGEMVDTNDAGFRYGLLPLAKPTDEVRVFFLGSSFGFRGATNDRTIAGFMERQLASLAQASSRRIRVINASGTSFCLTQSLVLLVTRVLAYEPDVIIVFHGPEMLFYASTYENRAGYPFDFVIGERLRDRAAGRLPPPNPLVSLLRRTYLMRHFHPYLGAAARQEELSRYHQVVPIDSLAQYEPYIDMVVSDVQKMSRIASAYGCRTVVMLPPWRSATLLPGAIERLSERVRAACASARPEAAHYVDSAPLIDELSARDLWRPDGIHWEDEGNRLIAERLVEALLSTGLLE